MSEKRHVVRVSIVGDEYTIRSDAEPDHTKAVAEYLDRTIRRVLQGNPLLETHKAAMLAAMQITDELFRERSSSRAADESVRSLIAEVRRWLPPAKRGELSEADSG